MPTAAYLTADATVSAHRAAVITKSDSTIYPEPTRAIYVGGAGNIKVDMADGSTAITFFSVPAGMILPIQVTRVYSADTTATNMVALY